MNTSFRFPNHTTGRGFSFSLLSVIRWLACITLGAAAAVLFQTCVVNTSAKEEQIDPGRQYLTSANIDENITSLLWSNDNGKIYYTGPAGLNVFTLAFNTVSNIVAGAPMTALSQSPDGSLLYYLTAPGGSGIANLWFVPASGGSAQMLADSILAYAVSPDTQTIAACNQFSESMFLINRTSGVRTPIGSGEPIQFSPDGLKLLYIPVGNKVPVIRDLAGGGDQPLLTDTDTYNVFRVIRWGPAGIFGVMRDTVLGYEYHYDKNHYLKADDVPPTVLATLYGNNGYYLSDDGRTLGYWTTNCLKVDYWLTGDCVTNQYSITFSTPSMDRKRSYVLHKTDYLKKGDAAISHNGTKFAYVAEGILYVLTL